MHVFVTCATGWVGSPVVDDLIEAGHQVTGLACDEEKAASLATKGAHVVRATLDDIDALRSAALDQRVIEALGSVLEGSERSLLFTSGLSGLARGATEADFPNPAALRKSESPHGHWPSAGCAPLRCDSPPRSMVRVIMDSSRSSSALRAKRMSLRISAMDRTPGPAYPGSTRRELTEWRSKGALPKLYTTPLPMKAFLSRTSLA